MQRRGGGASCAAASWCRARAKLKVACSSIAAALLCGRHLASTSSVPAPVPASAPASASAPLLRAASNSESSCAEEVEMCGCACACVGVQTRARVRVRAPWPCVPASTKARAGSPAGAARAWDRCTSCGTRRARTPPPRAGCGAVARSRASPICLAARCRRCQTAAATCRAPRRTCRIPPGATARSPRAADRGPVRPEASPTSPCYDDRPFGWRYVLLYLVAITRVVLVNCVGPGGGG